MHSTYWFLWSVRDLGWSRSSYGLEAGPWIWLLFVLLHFAKGLKRDSASSYLQGPTRSSSPGSQTREPQPPPTPSLVHVQSIQDLTTILPLFLTFQFPEAGDRRLTAEAGERERSVILNSFLFCSRLFIQLTTPSGHHRAHTNYKRTHSQRAKPFKVNSSGWSHI